MSPNHSGASATRRDFLTAAAAAAGTAMLSSSPAVAAPAADLIPAIDTHQHLW
ncbi:MAG: twin-arginine translocation signal domain-containing protein, partial [Planctomyces sp.]